MIYLASPYTSPILAEMETRYKVMLIVTADLLKNGYMVYSPIVHCHELSRFAGMPHNFHFWARYSFHMLDVASELWVVQLPGWQDSVGVAAEMAFWTATRSDSIQFISVAPTSGLPILP